MKKNQNKETRYHFIFWMIYLALWGARDMVFYPDFLGNIVINLVFTIPTAILAYFNLYFLVPRYLLNKKWGMYSILFIAGMAISTWVRYHITHYVFAEILGAMQAVQQFSSLNGLVILSSEGIILIAITMSLFFVREWYIKERYTRELEQKNIESELNMLKAQLQPHFLFNNLNTIYFLMESNPELAREVMIQFSDVLSHQLYNAKKDKVPLKDELESLKNYLKIQKIRHEDFLNLEYSFPKEIDDLQIAPMILLTFVENAFKHSQKEEGYDINIKVDIHNQDLHLSVANSNGHTPDNENGGVGLKNVKRRLELLYPNRHSLILDEQKDIYTVDLTMTLEANGQA